LLALSIGLLVILITWLKFQPFLAFLISSLVAGILLRMPIEQVAVAVQKGIGGLLGDLVIVVLLGAMLGKLVAESGAAQQIAQSMMKVFGEKKLTWAMMVTGLLVGIPLFYNVGFVLLIPLVFAVASQYKISAVYVGIPLLAALSVTHGFLPPHPSPVALVAQFQADMGLTLFYGLIVSLPAIIIAGPIFTKFVKNVPSKPIATFEVKPIAVEDLPSAWNSFFAALFPVALLIGMSFLVHNGDKNDENFGLLLFFSDAGIVMLISLIWASYSLGLRRGMGLQRMMDMYGEAIKEIAVILFIIGGAGALKQVLIESGVSVALGAAVQDWEINPLVLAWLITAIIRVSVGSATVAGLTTAGIVAPLMNSGINPNLMVLAIGSGSLMFSHVNDSGFWMFKTYFQTSIKDTLKTWSLMETIVSIVGLLGVLLLDLMV
jgi:Gnt-I system high-affinity gluconate transporter